jgi:hypothetical protein
MPIRRCSFADLSFNLSIGKTKIVFIPTRWWSECARLPFRMDVEAGLTAEQRNVGYVLPCVSRAEGTVVLSA